MKPDHAPRTPSSRSSASKVGASREQVRLVNKIYQQLRKASPLSSGQTTGELAVDIGDLVSVGRKHHEDVKQLLKMRFPKDRERFLKLLGQFDVNLLFENQYHLSSVKRLLPRLVRDAYGSPNGKLHKKK